MLITEIINEIKIVDYPESFFGSYFGNFSELPNFSNLKREESQNGNKILSYPDGRIMIGNKLYVE
jgi:hypothetical protein